MRHILGNIAIYLIVLFLIGAATLFGWIRSSQFVISNEETVIARFDASGQQFTWSQLGEQSYLRNCANCHGSDGLGWDQYPALNHAALMFMSPAGRDYVIDLHLYGLTSSRWGAPMPPMGHIQDIEMASVINYILTQFGNEEGMDQNTELLHPQDIAERRGQGLSPQDVNSRRSN